MEEEANVAIGSLGDRDGLIEEGDEEREGGAHEGRQLLAEGEVVLARLPSLNKGRIRRGGDGEEGRRRA